MEADGTEYFGISTHRFGRTIDFAIWTTFSCTLEFQLSDGRDLLGCVSKQKWIDDIPGGSLSELSLQQHSREHHFRNYLNLQVFVKIHSNGAWRWRPNMNWLSLGFFWCFRFRNLPPGNLFAVGQKHVKWLYHLLNKISQSLLFVI